MMNKRMKQIGMKELTLWLLIVTIFSVPERIVIRGPYLLIHPAKVRNDLINDKT
jgi:hypothetical protein